MRIRTGQAVNEPEIEDHWAEGWHDRARERLREMEASWGTRVTAQQATDEPFIPHSKRPPVPFRSKRDPAGPAQAWDPKNQQRSTWREMGPRREDFTHPLNPDDTTATDEETEQYLSEMGIPDDIERPPARKVQLPDAVAPIDLAHMGDQGQKNVEAVLALATPEEIEYWRKWYLVGHRAAVMLARKNKTDLMTAAAVIAVLSPKEEWNVNLELADAALSNNWPEVATLPDNRAKAYSIVHDRDFSVIRGEKIFPFFLSLFDPAKFQEEVVVDTHAASIWLGLRTGAVPGINDTVRAKMTEDYAKAGAKFGLTPQEAQACAWVVWKQIPVAKTPKTPKSAQADAGQQAGAGGWPLVPSKLFPGEMTLACPKCKSTNVMMMVAPSGRGTGPMWRSRMGDPGSSELNICQDCGMRGKTAQTGSLSAEDRAKLEADFIANADNPENLTMFELMFDGDATDRRAYARWLAQLPQNVGEARRMLHYRGLKAPATDHSRAQFEAVVAPWVEACRAELLSVADAWAKQKTRVAVRGGDIGMREMERWNASDRPYALLSAVQGGSLSERKERHAQLLQELQRLGLKHEDARGQWEEASSGKMRAEPSLWIKDIDLETALALGRKFDQDAVIWKSPEGVVGMYDLRNNTVRVPSKDGAPAFGAESVSVGPKGPKVDGLPNPSDQFARGKSMSFGVNYDFGDEKSVLPWDGKSPVSRGQVEQHYGPASTEKAAQAKSPNLFWEEEEQERDGAGAS